jgi:hypothetical protein
LIGSGFWACRGSPVARWPGSSRLYVAGKRVVPAWWAGFPTAFKRACEKSGRGRVGLLMVISEVGPRREYELAPPVPVIPVLAGCKWLWCSGYCGLKGFTFRRRGWCG